MKEYDKLIRNNVLEKIWTDGNIANWRILKDDKEKWEYLLKKFDEEVDEFKDALANPVNEGENILEEGADLIEVIVTFLDFLSISPSFAYLVSKFFAKRSDKGSFSEFIVLKSVKNSQNK